MTGASEEALAEHRLFEDHSWKCPEWGSAGPYDTMSMFKDHPDPDEKGMVLRSKNASSEPAYPKARASSS